MNNIHIRSEIGTLKSVLLHRPGNELLNIVPDTLEELLFDDIPYLRIAQEEHDAFARTLRENGVEVLYLEKLMAEVLDEHPEIRTLFLKQFLEEAHVTGNYYTGLIMQYLNEHYANNEQLVLKLMEGMRLNELPKEKANTLEDRLQDYNQTMLLDPLPNLYFQRDPFASVGDGILLHHMYSHTRRRETIFAEYIFRYHPKYKDVKKYYSRYDFDSIEGGDVLNLSAKAVAIGISQRTSANAIEKVATAFFKDENCKIREVYAFEIPRSRAFMHLDTVFTQIDRDKFTVHPSIVSPMRIFSLTPKEKGIRIEELNTSLQAILSQIIGTKAILLPCGGGDAIAAAREQWNDGSNTLCIAPGKVIAYQRNEVTNAYMRENGITVLEIPSCELSRGRGGPRCMSMPLLREDIE